MDRVIRMVVRMLIKQAVSKGMRATGPADKNRTSTSKAKMRSLRALTRRV